METDEAEQEINQDLLVTIADQEEKLQQLSKAYNKRIKENLKLGERIEELEKRLEITEEYDLDGNPIPIPPEDRDRAIDGICARDSTIKLQDDRIAELSSALKEIMLNWSNAKHCSDVAMKALGKKK